MVDDGHDVLGALREGDERRPLVEREVPRPSRLVPVLVVRTDDEGAEAVVSVRTVVCVLEHAVMLVASRPPRIGGFPRLAGVPALDVTVFVARRFAGVRGP